MVKFKGIIPAIVTPFTKNGDIDYEGIGKNLDFLIDNGVHGILATGSTGENVHLAEDEWRKVLGFVADRVEGKIPILAGSFGISTKQTIERTRTVEDIGADGVLICPPFYYSLTEEEIYEYYKAIGESVNIPIILYNAPYACKIDIQPELAVKLFEEVENIKGIKDASGIIARIHMCLSLNKDIAVYTAMDNIGPEALLLGAKGWISVAANVFPKQMVQIYEFTVKGDYKKAMEIYYRLLPYLNFMETRPATEWLAYTKVSIDILGLAGGYPRKPVLPVSNVERSKLEKLMQQVARVTPQ